ncbi:hypothetical protein CH340_16705 [Rhodoplanes serenus]|nr:hypothetical protein CH340_16705 [Rhodoplanes serenus]
MTDAPDRQRIDKWLWHARVVRTRSAAAALAAGGHVRVNGVRIDAASRAVRRGDVVTVALDRRVRVLTVTGFAERRGSADDTVGLYEEQGPPPDPPAPRPARRSTVGRSAIPAPAAPPSGTVAASTGCGTTSRDSAGQATPRGPPGRPEGRPLGRRPARSPGFGGCRRGSLACSVAMR